MSHILLSCAAATFRFNCKKLYVSAGRVDCFLGCVSRLRESKSESLAQARRLSKSGSKAFQGMEHILVKSSYDHLELQPS